MTAPPTDTGGASPASSDATYASAPTESTGPARTPCFAPRRFAPSGITLASLGPAFLVLAIALAASATSLGNGFAFDDRWIIQFNGRVHGIGRWMAIFRESYWPVLSNGL